MSKQSGIGDQLVVGGFMISNDIGAMQIGSPHGVFDVTGIDKGAPERILGRKDGRMAGTAWFNPTADRSHDVLSPVPTTDVDLSYLHTTILGGPAASLRAKQVSYGMDRPADGSLSCPFEALANGFPTEWGRQLTAGDDTLSAAGAGLGIDTAASASFGLQAYLHVLAFTGTSATITIQDNTADVPGTYTDVTGAAFTAVSAVGTQRIQTSRTQTVRQWVRFNVTGTFSVLTIVINMVKNLGTTTF